ncbi:MAG: efflux RND transporter permease subunit [Acidobacteria bacterium]|nr:efflux RND transporter permease subunit [Acidobacteriota bacterium]
MSTFRIGAAGRLASAFTHSKLTPLLMIASLLLGVWAVIALPREEEPQIIVPMVDVFVEMPGASPAEVEQRVTRPVEKLLWEVPGVEYIYSTSSAGRAMVIVRFLVGQDEEKALVRLNEKLAANRQVLPGGASPPVVQARSIDNVPVMALTLSGPGYDDVQVRQLAAHLQDLLKELPDIAEVTLIGGRPRQVSVELDPAALAARGLDPMAVQQALAANNVRLEGSSVVSGNASTRVEAGALIGSIDALRRVVVGESHGAPVWLGDVATVVDGGGEPADYVRQHVRGGEARPAVTISIAKRKGVNAIELTRAVHEKVDAARGYILPSDLDVAVTRDYGETAEQKSNELLWHMFLAVVSVSILIWLVLGRRESLVVLTAIPVTLALTLFVFYLYGYTLNRITLFALIFSIGILVDDAIVVVENIVRHMRGNHHDVDAAAVAVRAVDEVGNPTILATLAVIAAILPMAFVGGLMGPYMRPIPVGATAAMVFSLIVAFIVTPWASLRLLTRGGHGHGDHEEDRVTAAYRRVMRRLILEPKARWTFLLGVAVLLVLAILTVPTGLVTVKMLPFDNKSELQVVVHMPEGTPLETTASAADTLAADALNDSAVTSVQSYTGTSSPYTFNGLVRHYFLRRDPNLADLQVMLTPKEERSEQSHDIAKRIRERLVPSARALGATIQVVEVPPGPPVLQTIVAEVYGPDEARRLDLAKTIRTAMEKTTGVVDVYWYVDSPRRRVRLDVDTEKSMAAGVPAAAIASVVQMAGAGSVAGLLHEEQAREPVPVVLRLPRALRGTLDEVQSLRVGPRHTAIGELTVARDGLDAQPIYHKNLRPVTYVTADVAGQIESPVYAILAMNRALASVVLPEGYGLEIYNTHQPFNSSQYAMKWDGEWHITYEVFRDLGIAFAAVLVLIYILVVGWFQSFKSPLTIMLAIPFSLVGILPAHAALGAFFTATSMIGFIAGAGIVVRNSIILVDFIELRLRDGMPIEEAVVDAGAVRFRPMALTAAAVIVGSAVILFDPIFQGLAISLMAGEVASLLLSRMTVPITYYLTHRHDGVATAPAVSPEGVPA